jgi:hypothetical protein
MYIAVLVGNWTVLATEQTERGYLQLKDIGGV